MCQRLTWALFGQFDLLFLTIEQVMHSMFSGEECFLASEEWHQMMQHQYTPDMPPDLHDSVEQLFAYFTYAPSLVHKFYGLKGADLSTPELQQTISAALAQALYMQNKLAVWYEKFTRIAPPPTEALSQTDDILYPVILTYSDMFHSTIYCGYFSYMAIVNEVLRTLGYPGPHEARVVYFRDQICKSVEYSGVGVLGPYRLGFPLRVAYEAGDSVTRSWILARLEQFSKVYAALKPENYKDIP